VTQAYLSVEVETAENHKNSTEFGEQRPEDESETERQKKDATLKIHQRVNSKMAILRNRNTADT